MESFDDEFLAHFTDPVERLLLTGQAATVSEAERMVMDSSLEDAYELLRSGLSDDELAQHPLMRLYRDHLGSPLEDDLL